MSRRVQIALGAFGVAAVACAGIALFGLVSLNRFVEEAARFDPQEAAATAATIADLTPPEGYAPLLAMELGGMTTVTIMPVDRGLTESSRLVFTLLQAPAGAARADEARAMLAEQMRGSVNGRPAELALVEQRPIVLEGQELSLEIYEGESADGTPVREAQLPFQGRGGPALLVAAGDLALWDEAAVQAVLDSLRVGAEP